VITESVCNLVVLPQRHYKTSVSVIISLRCGNSVCLCSMDFVSGSKIEI